MSSGLIISTPPAAEPVLTADFKTWARIDTDDDNTLIASLLTAARRYCENAVRRQFIDATWIYTIDEWPANDVIQLPFPPLDSITTLKYYNTAGTLTTLTKDTDYTVDTYTEPGRVFPCYGKSWPSLRGYERDIEITFKAGYGTAGTDVPADILTAIKLLAAHWYEHRENVVIGATVADMPDAAAALLGPYRVFNEF